MKLRKALLLAATAVAALVAMAIPVSASAAVWLHEGEPLAEHTEFELSGGEVIEVGGSVLICEAHATITTEGGNTAQMTNFKITANSCAGLVGPLKGCEVTSAKATGLPWAIDVNAADLTVTGWKVDYVFDEECPVGKIETNFPNMTLVPFEEASAISLFEYSAEGPGIVDGEEAEIGSFGSLQFSEEEAGTYGIG
jgi:hypothetical protein